MRYSIELVVVRRMLGEMQGDLVESCKEFVRSIQRYSKGCELLFDRRIARYSIELGVVRRMLGEM